MYIVYEVSILWKVSGHVYCVWGIDIVERERSRILCMRYRYCGKWAVMYIVYVVSILPLFLRFVCYFRTVLTVWYICLHGVVYHVFHSIKKQLNTTAFNYYFVITKKPCKSGTINYFYFHSIRIHVRKYIKIQLNANIYDKSNDCYCQESNQMVYFHQLFI